MKGQSGIEMLFAFGILSIILIFSVVVYIQRSREVTSTQDFLDAKNICYEFSSLIDRVMSGGNGFSEKISYTKNYDMNVFGDLGFIMIDLKDTSISCSFATKDVNNQTDERFVISKGNFSVENDGEKVVFKK